MTCSACGHRTASAACGVDWPWGFSDNVSWAGSAASGWGRSCWVPRWGVLIALLGSGLVYGAIKYFIGIRLDQEAEYAGADLSLHQVSAYPEKGIERA